MSRFPNRPAALLAALLIAALSIANSTSGATDANAQQRVPDTHHLAMLIHSTVAALDHANGTGNYTVIHEMASPAFQRANSPERLSQIFSQLRRRKLNLAPSLLFDPLLVRPARIDGDGFLRLTGLFPTQPMRVHFDLRYQNVEGRWRLFGISIQPRVRQIAGIDPGT